MASESVAGNQVSASSSSVLDKLEQECRKKIFESPASVKYQKLRDEYSDLSFDEKKRRESWLNESILASSGRDVQGSDGTFVLLSEDTYMEMIVEMVDKMVDDVRLCFNIASSHALSPLEGNSLCPVHPYGGVVGYCECGKPLGRVQPHKREYIPGCCCPERYHLAHSSRAHGVVFYTQHRVQQDGTCGGVQGLDGSLSIIDEHLPMFARLARFLFKYANNQFIVREVLGGPYSGYLQAAVMVALRFSVSDTVRVSTRKCDRMLKDDVFKEVVGSEKYVRALISLRQQGFFRGWMNTIVQNKKRGVSSDASCDEGFTESFNIRGKVVKFRGNERQEVVVPAAVPVADPVKATRASRGGKSTKGSTKVHSQSKESQVARLKTITARLIELVAVERSMPENQGMSPNDLCFYHCTESLELRAEIDVLLASKSVALKEKFAGWSFCSGGVLSTPKDPC